MKPQQGPAPQNKTLTEKVAAILREDIQLTGNTLYLRQPPIGDDSDSWSEDKGAQSWQHVAQTIVDVVRRWDTPPGSETPDA